MENNEQVLGSRILPFHVEAIMAIVNRHLMVIGLDIRQIQRYD